jgi:hypothetical protein
MLEFNLDGDLFTGFDASNAYQRVAGGDPLPTASPNRKTSNQALPPIL